jgi:hypothetical protein
MPVGLTSVTAELGVTEKVTSNLPVTAPSVKLPPALLLCDDATTTTCNPGTLNYSTTYYWYVFATDNHGASTAGDIWQFTTEDELLKYVFLPLTVKDG